MESWNQDIRLAYVCVERIVPVEFIFSTTGSTYSTSTLVDRHKPRNLHPTKKANLKIDPADGHTILTCRYQHRFSDCEDKVQGHPIICIDIEEEYQISHAFWRWYWTLLSRQE